MIYSLLCKYQTLGDGKQAAKYVT